MKSRVWNPTRTSESRTPWVRSAPVYDIQVSDLPQIQGGAEVCGPDSAEVCGPDSNEKAVPFTNQLPASMQDKRLKRRAYDVVKSSLGRLFIPPSFLISSLLVFFLIPDSMLKGTYSVDLRARCHAAFTRLIDVLGATIGLILAAPLFLVVSILIKLDSPGSVIYKQVRVGQDRRNGDRRGNFYRLKGDRRNGDRRKEDIHGRLFVLYKFRSMRQNAEKKSGPVWAQMGDPRITKVGKLLRVSRADELPQLFNILKGDMSLVGPRPERPYFVSQFVSSISRYQERLRVKPGLTGLAQVMGGYDTCIGDVHSKLSYDLNYVHNRSMRNDLKILLKTFVVVICGKGVY